MKCLGLSKSERIEILQEAYSLTGRLLTNKRERLEWELGNFIAYKNGKTFYKERSDDPSFDAHLESQETSLDFTKEVLYDSVFG